MSSFWTEILVTRIYNTMRPIPTIPEFLNNMEKCNNSTIPEFLNTVEKWNNIDTISFIVIAIVSHALPGTNVHWLNPCI